LAAADLADFQQGANLTITVARVQELSTINGFRMGHVSVVHSESVEVVPAP